MVSFDNIRAVCIFLNYSLQKLYSESFKSRKTFWKKNLPIEMDQTVVQTVETKIICFVPNAAEEFFWNSHRIQLDMNQI